MSDDTTITISVALYRRLMNDHDFLMALRACGVDNWDGYSDAQEMAGAGEDDE